MRISGLKWVKSMFISGICCKKRKGEYLGTIEVTQDIAPIQKITGEKRLLSDA